jgi:hypothetical protein
VVNSDIQEELRKEKVMRSTMRETGRQRSGKRINEQKKANKGPHLYRDGKMVDNSLKIDG